MQQPSSIRALLNIAWPMLVAQLAMMANAVIDTAMSGHLTAIDLAAVGIAASIMATVLMSLVSVLLALPPLIAHLYGAGNHADIGREIHQSAWISLVLASITMLLLSFPEPFIAISDLQPAVEVKVRAYLAYSAWGVPALFAMRIFFGLATGIGKPRPVMVFNLISLSLKIPMNAIFIYGWLGMPELGGPGCAVSTAVDAWLMAFVVWRWALRQPAYQAFELRRRFTPPERAAIVEFLKLGIPIGLTFIADVTAFTLMALFIARLGPYASGSHQIAANLAALAFMVPLSIGNATAVLVGQALGAHQQERARHISWEGIRLGMLIALAICMVYWLGAPYIATLYTNDSQVQKLAIPLIMMAGLYHLGDALQAVSVNALRGYKRTVIPMIVYTSILWGLGLGGGFVLGLTDIAGHARGASGFWIAEIAAIWLAGMLVALYLKAVSKQHFVPA